MNKNKYIKLIIILFFVSVLLAVGYYYALQEEINSLNDSRDNTKKNILDSLSVTLNHVSESANHLNAILESNINTKNFTFDNFNKLTAFNIYPFRDVIQNIRFSPIIYPDEIAGHNIFGNTQINGYQLKPAGGLINNNFYFQQLI